MRSLYVNGKTQGELARMFKTTRGNVHLIVRNKSRVVGFDTSTPDVISGFSRGDF